MLNSVEFYGDDKKVNAAYEDALQAFSESRPYKVESRFVGNYREATLTDMVASGSITAAQKTGAYINSTGVYGIKIEGIPFHTGEYKKVVIFRESFINKLNKAMEGNYIDTMNDDERVIFIKYLNRLDRGFRHVGKLREDITNDNSMKFIIDSLDIWMTNIAFGDEAANPKE